MIGYPSWSSILSASRTNRSNTCRTSASVTESGRLRTISTRNGVPSHYRANAEKFMASSRSSVQTRGSGGLVTR